VLNADSKWAWPPAASVCGGGPAWSQETLGNTQHRRIHDMRKPAMHAKPKSALPKKLPGKKNRPADRTGTQNESNVQRTEGDDRAGRSQKQAIKPLLAVAQESARIIWCAESQNLR
jgi:hypothetical protein